MPAVIPTATVLVTGSSGFSGIWITRTLLEAGYRVHGTVRSTSKGIYLQELFKTHGDRFKPIVVEDTSKPGAFDKALIADIAAVIHVAGVAHFSPPEGQAVIETNTQSVIDLMNSLLIHGTNVKRFVYMSSAQALLGKKLSHVYTEDDWNDKAVADVNEKRHRVGGQSLYAASKVLAERAIIDFTEEHKDEIGWDATRLLPAWIFGPIIHDCKSVDNLNLSSKLFYQMLTTEREKGKENEYASEYIDVRDVADAFVAALKIEAAGGERFILDAGAFTFQNLYDAVYSQDANMSGVSRGNPDAPKFNFPGPFCNPTKAKSILQLNDFRTLDQCAIDALKSFRERGFQL